MTINYEYKTVDLNKRNKEFYSSSFWHPFFVISSRATAVMDKLTKDGWEYIDSTHDFLGNPRILRFRRKKCHLDIECPSE